VASATHYELLGVGRDAPTSEIRDAYRRLARVHHPDAGGGGVDMADINRAWHVLRDDGRRREYDLSLAMPSQVRPTTSMTTNSTNQPPVPPDHPFFEPARFPWRFLGVLFLIGLVFVVIGIATASDPVPPTVDNVLEPGSCVVIDTNGDAVEQLCSKPHDGVVTVFLASPGQCPDGTEAHRDHLGMGTACVRLG
jgi:hypothetical protein